MANKKRTEEQLAKYRENRKKKYHENTEYREKILLKQKENRLNNQELVKLKAKKLYAKNKEKDNTRSKAYREKNKLKIAEKQKIYRQRDKEKRKEYFKNRASSDILFKLTVNLRSMVSKQFKRNGYKKGTKTEGIIGCSFEEFKTYLESKFEAWMNWDNRGLYNGEPNYGWDIDHIIPLSTAKTEDDVIRLNHYTNLQPLCSHINREVKRSTILKQR